MKKALPVGVENFEDLVKSEYYYVDKTMFIKEMLDLKGKVNLFTRPRRFGKTLNLSIASVLFEDTGDKVKNEQNKRTLPGDEDYGCRRKIYRTDRNVPCNKSDIKIGQTGRF